MGSSREMTDEPVTEPAAPDAQPKPFRLGYRPEIDGIRGIGVVIILFGHLFLIWPAAGLTVLPGAFIMVDMFFVLSGFLITTLLLEERQRYGNVSMSNFYQRRGLRLIPGLVFMIAAYLLWIAVTEQSMRHALIANTYVMLYVANWAQVFKGWGTLGFTLGHLWTLSVEEQYYIIFFPTLLFLLLRFKASTVLKILCVTIIPAMLWRSAWALHASDSNLKNLYIRTDTRVDALLVGPAIAVALHLGWPLLRWARYTIIPVSVFLLWGLVRVGNFDRWMYFFGFTLFDMCCGAFLLWTIGSVSFAANFFRTRPVVWLGRASYGIYIWHPWIYLAVARVVPTWPRPAAAALAVTAAMLCATFSFYVIELPFLRLKRRRATPAVGPPVDAKPAAGD